MFVWTFSNLVSAILLLLIVFFGVLGWIMNYYSKDKTINFK